jgi:Rhodopirellula transposase DDE domain
VVEKKTEKQPEIIILLEILLETLRAGSPTDEKVYWICLKPWQIAVIFNEKYNIEISHGLVKRLINQLGYCYRKQSKQLATGKYANRDEQFRIICQLILVMSMKSPVLSIDCKKKEKMGNFYREGKCYSTAPVKVFDHDYEHLSEGKIVPHGIYDLQSNEGYISIGDSSETADFVIDNLLWWWQEYGIHKYPDAKNILLLCDAGGANSYRHHIFKHRLLKLADETGLSIIICHYPPYCSKWNPIEHRLFSQVHRTMQGVVLSNYEMVKEIIAKTATKTGLKVVVRLNLGEYKTGIKIDKTEIDQKRILYHPAIPELNYRICTMA